MTTRIDVERPHCDAADRCVHLGSITRWPGAACRPIRGSCERPVTRTGHCAGHRAGALTPGGAQSGGGRARHEAPSVGQAKSVRLIRAAPGTWRHGPPDDGRRRMATRSLPEERASCRRGPRSHGGAAVCVRSRTTAGSRGPRAIRRRPGDDSRSSGSWTKSWPRHRTSSTCFGLASNREPHHRSSATCWMSSSGGCRPTACSRWAGPRPPCSS